MASSLKSKEYKLIHCVNL